MFVKLQREKKKQILVARQHRLQQILLKWHKQFHLSIQAREEEQKTIRMDRFHVKVTLRKHLRAWKNLIRKHKHTKQFIQHWRQKQASIKKRAFFNYWKRALLLYLARDFHMMRKQYISLQSEKQESDDKVASFEMEHLNLVQKLHELAADTTKLRMTLKQKDEHHVCYNDILMFC